MIDFFTNFDTSSHKELQTTNDFTDIVFFPRRFCDSSETCANLSKWNTECAAKCSPGKTRCKVEGEDGSISLKCKKKCQSKRNYFPNRINYAIAISSFLTSRLDPVEEIHPINDVIIGSGIGRNFTVAEILRLKEVFRLFVFLIGPSLKLLHVS